MRKHKILTDDIIKAFKHLNSGIVCNLLLSAYYIVYVHLNDDGDKYKVDSLREYGKPNDYIYVQEIDYTKR